MFQRRDGIVRHEREGPLMKATVSSKNNLNKMTDRDGTCGVVGIKIANPTGTDIEIHNKSPGTVPREAVLQDKFSNALRIFSDPLSELALLFGEGVAAMCGLRGFGGCVPEEFFNVNGKSPLALKWLLNHEYVANADIAVQEPSLINGPPPLCTIVRE